MNKDWQKVLQIALFLIVSVQLPLISQVYTVTTTEDLTDSNIGDGIFSPQSFRSALENLERFGGDKITFAFDEKDYYFTQGFPLPQINKPIHIEGKGSKLHGEYGDGRQLVIGLWLNAGASNSLIEDLQLINFAQTALVIQCNNSTFKALEIYNNPFAISMNNASNNYFGDTKNAYTKFIIHNNGPKPLYGGGIAFQLVDNCNNNIIDNVAFGVDITRPSVNIGNRQGALLISKGCNENIIKNCKFSYNKGFEAISVREASGTLIENCDFQYDRIQKYEYVYSPNNDSTYQRNGINMENCQNTTIKHCIFGTHTQRGLIARGVNIKIDSNVFAFTPNRELTAMVSGQGHYIAFSALSVEGVNIVVSNNYFGNSRTGLSVGGAKTKLYNGTDSVYIHSNYFGQVIADSVFTPSTGISLNGGYIKNVIIGDKDIVDTTISNSSPLSNHIIGSSQYGIDIISYDSLVNNIIIANNDIGYDVKTKTDKPTKLSGIHITGNPSDIDIYDNSIVSLKNGVEIDTFRLNLGEKPIFNPRKIRVSGNVIGNEDKIGIINSEAGVQVNGASTVNIYKNTILGSNHGIWCRSPLNNSIKVYENDIGHLSNKDKANRGHGVYISDKCSDVSVGLLNNPNSANNIVGNRLSGIKVEDSASKVLIVYNTINENKQASISLNDSEKYYSENKDLDSLDLDTGANSLQNAPEITTIDTIVGGIEYKARFNASPGKYLLQLYRTYSYPLDSTHYRPLLEFVNEFEVIVPDSGKIIFTKQIISPLARLLIAGRNTIALTATNQDLETSQLGRSVGVKDKYIDLEVFYDGNDTITNDRNIKTKLFIVNNSTVSLSNVVVIDSIPDSFIVDSITVTNGSPILTGREIKYTIPMLSQIDTAVMTVYGLQFSGDTHKRFARVDSLKEELNTKNNFDTIEVKIIPLTIKEDSQFLNTYYYSSNLDLIVVFDGKAENIQLYDLLGNKVSVNMVAHNNTLVLNELPLGIYLLSFRDYSNVYHRLSIIHY